MRRLKEFLRSVIPADPYQLLFLFGTVYLVIAPRLRWWPHGLAAYRERLANPLGGQLESLGVLFLFPIIFAGLAGYFCCFWPGEHPTKRILWSVCLPALAGFSLTLGRLLYLTQPYSSVLESNSSVFHTRNWMESVWMLESGFHVFMVGISLVVIFASRMAFGIATLPLALPQSSIVGSHDDELWRRVKILIWVLVGPLFILVILLDFLTVGIPVIVRSHLPAYITSPWFLMGSYVLAAFPLGFVLWLAGKKLWQIVRALLRSPHYIYLAAAVAFPIGADIVLSVGHYLVDRTLWAAHDFGRFDAPQFASYFGVPNIWLFLMVFPAFFEEMIFRGVLQTQFLRRYGVYRGLFLVGIVWAAFHFSSDFRFSGASDFAVVQLLGFRLFVCLSLGFVLGWLTLRSKSLIPAAIAHTLYNVAVYSNAGPPFPWKATVRVVLLAVLAVALFRWWPVDVEEDQEVDGNTHLPIASPKVGPSIPA